MWEKWNCPNNLTEVRLILLSRLADQAQSNRSTLIIKCNRRHLTHYTNAKTCSTPTSASSPLMIVTSTMWPGVTSRALLCTNLTFWGQMHESKYVLFSPNTTERICPSSARCLKPIPLCHVTTKINTQTLRIRKRWKSFKTSSSIRVQCPVNWTSARV